MSYTITSATWGDEGHTSAILQTVESGAVAVSLDRPALWLEFMEWASTPGNTVETNPVLVSETLARVSKQLEIVRSEKKPSLTFTRQSISLAGVGAVEKTVVEGATKGVAGMFAVSSGGVFAGGTFGVGLGASTTLYNASDTLTVGVSRQGKVTVKRSDGSGLWDVFFDLMIV